MEVYSSAKQQKNSFFSTIYVLGTLKGDKNFCDLFIPLGFLRAEETRFASTDFMTGIIIVIGAAEHARMRSTGAMTVGIAMGSTTK